MRFLVPALAVTTWFGGTAATAADSWPQFRGPKGAGVMPGTAKLPTRIGPDRNVLWKTALPPGHSSPVIAGDRIFLTAVRDKKLFTLGIDRATGKVLWQAEAPYKRAEKIHQIGSLAQSTPATDGSLVVSLFGSCGLFCYDKNGKRLWHVPMGPFKNDFGAASSLLIVGDRVLLNQDHDTDSFLMCLDKRTGKLLWKTDRSEFPVGYATPVIWEVAGRKQVVVAGTLRVIGYDFDSGKELWTVGGMARVLNMTPTVGPDNTLYVAGWAAGADAGERIEAPPFADMLRKHDRSGNGTLELNEMPEGPLKQRFTLIDRDKDGHITKKEYDGMRHIFHAAQNRLVAIKPGGRGDITATHVLWSHDRHLPFVPSPLLYKGQLFLVKNGGFVTTLDAHTGKLAKTGRAPGAANYYASPVGGDGKVYLVSERGELTVISAEPQWRFLSRARFEEDVYATPALLDGRIYLRTTGHLYCFGEKSK